jgi:hypothetical protein
MTCRPLRPDGLRHKSDSNTRRRPPHRAIRPAARIGGSCLLASFRRRVLPHGRGHACRRLQRREVARKLPHRGFLTDDGSACCQSGGDVGQALGCGLLICGPRSHIPHLGRREVRPHSETCCVVAGLKFRGSNLRQLRRARRCRHQDRNRDRTTRRPRDDQSCLGPKTSPTTAPLTKRATFIAVTTQLRKRCFA